MSRFEVPYAPVMNSSSPALALASTPMTMPAPVSVSVPMSMPISMPGQAFRSPQVSTHAMRAPPAMLQESFSSSQAPHDQQEFYYEPQSPEQAAHYAQLVEAAALERAERTRVYQQHQVQHRHYNLPVAIHSPQQEPTHFQSQELHEQDYPFQTTDRLEQHPMYRRVYRRPQTHPWMCNPPPSSSQDPHGLVQAQTQANVRTVQAQTHAQLQAQIQTQIIEAEAAAEAEAASVAAAMAAKHRHFAQLRNRNPVAPGLPASSVSMDPQPAHLLAQAPLRERPQQVPAQNCRPSYGYSSTAIPNPSRPLSSSPDPHLVVAPPVPGPATRLASAPCSVQEQTLRPNSASHDRQLPNLHLLLKRDSTRRQTPSPPGATTIKSRTSRIDDGDPSSPMRNLMIVGPEALPPNKRLRGEIGSQESVAIQHAAPPPAQSSPALLQPHSCPTSPRRPAQRTASYRNGIDGILRQDGDVPRPPQRTPSTLVPMQQQPLQSFNNNSSSITSTNASRFDMEARAQRFREQPAATNDLCVSYPPPSSVVTTTMRGVGPSVNAAVRAGLGVGIGDPVDPGVGIGVGVGVGVGVEVEVNDLDMTPYELRECYTSDEDWVTKNPMRRSQSVGRSFHLPLPARLGPYDRVASEPGAIPKYYRPGTPVEHIEINEQLGPYQPRGSAVTPSSSSPMVTAEMRQYGFNSNSSKNRLRQRVLTSRSIVSSPIVVPATSARCHNQQEDVMGARDTALQHDLFRKMIQKSTAVPGHAAADRMVDLLDDPAMASNGSPCSVSNDRLLCQQSAPALASESSLRPRLAPPLGVSSAPALAVETRQSSCTDHDHHLTHGPADPQEFMTAPDMPAAEETQETNKECLAELLVRSKEFLSAKSLVRNRRNEIDWVATFLNVGFESNSIYSLMCPLRKGRWKAEEERYTMELLRLLENGTIRLRHGQSIRGYIAKKLHSDDMRVLKKLSNCKMFHFAKSINPCMAEEEAIVFDPAKGGEAAQLRLERLRSDFLRSVQLEALVAVRKYLSDSSIRDLLNARDACMPTAAS